MILSLNGTALNRCNVAGFQPYEVKEEFQMLAGNKRVDKITQKRILNITYEVIKSGDLLPIRSIHATLAAVTVSYTDMDGTAVSFSADMSPPQYAKRRTLKDGQWLIGQCTFTLNEL